MPLQFIDDTCAAVSLVLEGSSAFSGGSYGLIFASQFSTDTAKVFIPKKVLGVHPEFCHPAHCGSGEAI